MSKRNSKLSVASGPLKTTKTVLKMSSLPPPRPSGVAVGKRIKPLFASLKSSPDGTSFAPAAVSNHVARSMVVNGDFFKSVRIRACAPLCAIVEQATANVSNGALQFSTLSYNGTSYAQGSAATALLNPLRMEIFQPQTSTTYAQGIAIPNSSSIANLASTFARYRMAGGRFRVHYEPQASSNDGSRFAIAFSSDPFHPQIGVPSFNNTAKSFPGVNTLDDTPNSFVFPAWESWSMEFSGCADDWKYMYSPVAYGASVSQGGSSLSESCRLDFVGALACICTNGTTGSICGRLYLDTEWEFCDPFPVTGLVSNLSLRALLMPQAMPEVFEESKEEKRAVLDEDTVLDSPAVLVSQKRLTAPPPSSLPPPPLVRARV